MTLLTSKREAFRTSPGRKTGADYIDTALDCGTTEDFDTAVEELIFWLKYNRLLILPSEGYEH